MVIMTKNGAKKIVADALVSKYEKDGWQKPGAVKEAAEAVSEAEPAAETETETPKATKKATAKKA